MSDRICYIVGAGESYGLTFTPAEGDYVIAADGGFAHLLRQNMRTDLLIGDFDSLSVKPEHTKTVLLEKEKDETDMYAAISEGIQQGYDLFHIYGGTGGRFDHTIANLQLIACLSQTNKRAFLHGDGFVVTSITDTSIIMGAHHRGIISIFSHSNESTGVCLEGLKYRLDDATVTSTFPIGVSNEFTGTQSKVSVLHGTLILILPKNDKEFVL